MRTRKKQWMYVVVSAISLLVFGACQTNEDSKDRLITANNEVIKLADGEKAVASAHAGNAATGKYKKYFNSSAQYQAPLNKVFFGHACTFYYGIPLSDDAGALYTTILEAWKAKTIATAISADSSDGKLFIKDSLTYVLVEVIRTPRNNILLAGAVGNDSALLMSYYQNSNLRTRISDDKKN